MRNSLRTFVVGLLVLVMSINSAAACRWSYGHGGHRAYGPVYYGPVAYGSPCGPPTVVYRSYAGGCGPYCGPCHGVVVDGVPRDRVPAPAPPAEPDRLPAPRPLPPPREPATVDRPIDIEPAPELPPEPPVPDTFLPERPVVPEPMPPVEPEDDLFGPPVEVPAESPDDLFDVPEDVEVPLPVEPPMEDPDDLFGPAPIEPTEPIEPEQPAEPAEEPADEPFDFFLDAEEPGTEEMPADAEEQPADIDEEPADSEEMPAEEEPADDFDDLFSDVLREPGGLASANLRTWIDNTGNYSCRGRLVRFLDGQVQLVKDNGRTTTVPLYRLSATDLEFVHRQASAQRAETYQTARAPLPRLAN